MQNEKKNQFVSFNRIISNKLVRDAEKKAEDNWPNKYRGGLSSVMQVYALLRIYVVGKFSTLKNLDFQHLKITWNGRTDGWTDRRTDGRTDGHGFF